MGENLDEDPDMNTNSNVHVVAQFSGGESIPAKQVDAELKLAHQRKVYIQIRVPKLRTEIKALVEERKSLEAEPPSKNLEAAARQKIYVHHHLLSLRKELQALEDEKQSVFEFLKKATN
jgi:hypothetical protein